MSEKTNHASCACCDKTALFDCDACHSEFCADCFGPTYWCKEHADLERLVEYEPDGVIG